MNTKIFKSKEISSLKNKVKTFQKQNEIVIVNESSFFDRIDEKETTVLSYYI